MGWYERRVLPHLVELACRSRPTTRQRAKIVPAARGRVLELGFGSGLNLPHYDAAAVGRLWALEPSEEMLALAEERIAAAPFPVEPLVAFAESIPLETDSADTVVVTYTLCTVPDAGAALREARRALRPDGRLLFCEHGEAPDASVRRWQRWLDPLWSRLAGGCHLDRPIRRLLESAGFSFDSIDTMYLPGWRPATFNVWGAATPADAPQGDTA